MKSQAIDAMAAIFELCEAIHKGELSTRDLQEVMTAAIESGHEMMQIQLWMAVHALRLTIAALPPEKSPPAGTVAETPNG